MGNTGILGGLHAAVAPLATKLIDIQAYDGVDVRRKISKELYNHVHKSGARVLDLCCGVGMSTFALKDAFHDGAVIGLDTSPEMISMALAISRHTSIVKKIGAAINVNANKFLAALRKKTHNWQDAYDKATNERMIQFTRGNAESTMFPKASFDLVTIMYEGYLGISSALF